MAIELIALASWGRWPWPEWPRAWAASGSDSGWAGNPTPLLESIATGTAQPMAAGPFQAISARRSGSTIEFAASYGNVPRWNIGCDAPVEQQSAERARFNSRTASMRTKRCRQPGRVKRPRVTHRASGAVIRFQRFEQARKTPDRSNEDRLHGRPREKSGASRASPRPARKRPSFAEATEFTPDRDYSESLAAFATHGIQPETNHLLVVVEGGTIAEGNSPGISASLPVERGARRISQVRPRIRASRGTCLIEDLASIFSAGCGREPAGPLTTRPHRAVRSWRF